jgi:hypothetical protein
MYFIGMVQLRSKSNKVMDIVSFWESIAALQKMFCVTLKQKNGTQAPLSLFARIRDSFRQRERVCVYERERERECVCVRM